MNAMLTVSQSSGHLQAEQCPPQRFVVVAAVNLKQVGQSPMLAVSQPLNVSARVIGGAAIHDKSLAGTKVDGEPDLNVNKRVAASRAREIAQWERLEAMALSDEDLAELDMPLPREMFEEDWHKR